MQSIGEATPTGVGETLHERREINFFAYLSENSDEISGWVIIAFTIFFLMLLWWKFDNVIRNFEPDGYYNNDGLKILEPGSNMRQA